MLIDIANGEKTISALRTFLGLDLHKVEVSDYEKCCLFPKNCVIDEGHPGTEPTITEANLLERGTELPTSPGFHDVDERMEVDEENTGGLGEGLGV